MSTLPPITTLPTLPTSTQTSTLDLLFEPCPHLHTLSLPLLTRQQQPPPRFQTYAALIAAIQEQLLSILASTSSGNATEPTNSNPLNAILSAHPRLGEKRVETLSEASRAEQANLQGGSDAAAAAEEGEKLRALNEEYERAFPGLRYVVFVNNRSRPVIMADMRRRIDASTPRQEKLDAIHAMCDIANDRVRKLGAV